MPAQFWELCNLKSKVVLAYLYKEENGVYPDWYLELSGKKKPLITISPEVEEDMHEETNKFMSQSPHPGHEKGEK